MPRPPKFPPRPTRRTTRRPRTPRAPRVPRPRVPPRPDLRDVMNDSIRVVAHTNAALVYSDASFVVSEDNGLMVIGIRENGDPYAVAYYAPGCWSVVTTIPAVRTGEANTPPTPEPVPAPSPHDI